MPMTLTDANVLVYRPTTFRNAHRLLWLTALGLVMGAARWWLPLFDDVARVPRVDATTIAEVAPYLTDSLGTFAGLSLAISTLSLYLVDRCEPWIRERARAHAQRRGYGFVIADH